jgi:uncharacterized protein
MADSSRTLLKLDDLDEGRNIFSLEVQSGDLELVDEFFTFGPVVTAEVEVRRSMDNFVLDGLVCCRIGGDCYRCLKAADQSVEARFHLILQRRTASPEELESAEEDGYIEIVDPGTRQIDLCDYIREAIILDLPMRIPTPDATGHCPQCGDDLAEAPNKNEQKETDPRWAALGQIQL